MSNAIVTNGASSSTTSDGVGWEGEVSANVTDVAERSSSASNGNGKRRAFVFDGSTQGSSAFSAAPSPSDAWRIPPLPPPPVARSPVSGACPSTGFPFLFEGGQHGLGAAMQEAVERSLPATPRSPSPTCSPPSSPKRAKSSATQDEGVLGGELSAAEEDLETRAAALGLHEVERRVWRETALPPTPSSPSPTFSPPGSPKTTQRQAELALLTAEQAAVKLAYDLSLRSIRPLDAGSRSCDSRCDSDSDVMGEVEVQTAIAAWELANARGESSALASSSSGRKKRQL